MISTSWMFRMRFDGLQIIEVSQQPGFLQSSRVRSMQSLYIK